MGFIVCTALDLKGCDVAVMAGANFIQLPQQILKTGITSNSAKCRTLDATADGYGQAEGTGALYLKRLSDAIRDRDPIRAVIRGMAVNNNGRTPRGVFSIAGSVDIACVNSPNNVTASAATSRSPGSRIILTAIRREEPQLQLVIYDFNGDSKLSMTAENIFVAFQEAFQNLLEI
ncbi:hypothetical protein ANO14919_007790 [Xylariales sp. No.14919]|nr:hypothetical protein ANO14919_007790 [Xylariales sp. No.14919]